jgi:hypothetical protein
MIGMVPAIWLGLYDRPKPMTSKHEEKPKEIESSLTAFTAHSIEQVRI